jgi:acetylornithine deacetylase
VNDSTNSPARPPDGAPATAWLFDRLEALCRDDTTTGHEDRGLGTLRELLRECGAEVELQEAAPGRHNVLATFGAPPRLLFSTHLDTVPPFLPPRRAATVLHGRGTCDAKGQLIAQLAAIAALRARGVDGLAWLGVVGEETDSIGAQAALHLAARFQQCIAVVDGEPTENRLATGQRGTMQLRLSTRGIAAHSGTPERGRSAIWPLLDWLQRLRELPLAEDPELGQELWNLGLLHGGAAPNVVPPAAEATLFVRALPGSSFAERARELAPPDATAEVLSSTPPDRYGRLPGFPHAVVPFGSDAPRLRKLARGHRVVLCGPGSITVAHTEDEHLRAEDLQAGCRLLVDVGEALLAEARA